MDYDYWAETIENNIPGLMSQNEIKFIMRCVRSSPKRDQYVNLGTYLGKSTAAICVATSREVITIDTFKYTGRLGRSTPKIVKKNLAQLGLVANIITASSSTKVPNIVKKVGFLFIDTQHTARQLNAELNIWLPYMARRGVIALHDYHKTYPGYVSTINARLKEHWELLGVQDTTIGFRKP